MKRLILLTVLGLFAVGVGRAVASPSSMLSVSPSAPVVGDSLTWAGCGYVPGQTVEVQSVFNSKTASVIYQIDETTDASGCFNTSNATGLTALYAGKWTSNVYPVDAGTGLLSKKAATLVFTVS